MPHPPNTVIKWRQRFAARGLAGLQDSPRPGAARKYDQGFRQRVLAVLEQPAPAGQATWDGSAVAKAVNGSVHAVWRVLRQEGICLQRQRSWCVSTDPQFAAKAADIVGLYLHPPAKALVAKHPQVHFHFTPTSASWLNQVEIWFGIFARKALRGLSSTSTAELRQAIEAFVAAYTQNAKPFKWRKREVKGPQLRNTIVNICN